MAQLQLPDIPPPNEPIVPPPPAPDIPPLPDVDIPPPPNEEPGVEQPIEEPPPGMPDQPGEKPLIA